MRLDGQVDAAGLEHPNDRGHPFQVAFRHHRDDVLPAQPASQQGSTHPVGPGIEFGVRPLPIALDARDGVRVGLDPPFEELMEPEVGQWSALSLQAFQLKGRVPQAKAGSDGGSASWIGGHQFQCPQVISGDPAGEIGVHRIHPVAHSQHRPVPAGRTTRSARRCDSSTSPPRPFGSTTASSAGTPTPSSRATSAIGNSLCNNSWDSIRCVSRSRARQDPVRDAQWTRNRVPTGWWDVAGHHLGFAGQRGEHLEVRGQQHGTRGDHQGFRQLTDRDRQIVRDRSLEFAHPGPGQRRPPRDGGESAGRQHIAPEVPAGFRLRVHRQFPSSILGGWSSGADHVGVESAITGLRPTLECGAGRSVGSDCSAVRPASISVAVPSARLGGGAGAHCGGGCRPAGRRCQAPSPLRLGVPAGGAAAAQLGGGSRRTGHLRWWWRCPPQGGPDVGAGARPGLGIGTCLAPESSGAWARDLVGACRHRHDVGRWGAPPGGRAGVVGGRQPRWAAMAVAGFPPQRVAGGTDSPFIRKESGSKTAPSPMVTP